MHVCIFHIHTHTYTYTYIFIHIHIHILVALFFFFSIFLWYAGDEPAWLQKLLTIIVAVDFWLVSLCLHEFGHALCAYKGGDTSVEDKGYLELNLFKYTDLVRSVIIPTVLLFIGGFGLPGGAVFISPSRLRSKWWETAVSLAGPFATFLCAIVASIPFWFMSEDVERDILKENTIGAVYWQCLGFVVFIQCTAMVLNLLPLPPFDGFGACLPHLPEGVRAWLYTGQNYTYASYGSLAFVFLMFWRIPLFVDAIYTLSDTVLGVDSQIAQAGMSRFLLIR
jgi:Zn-dependent protease